MLDNAPWSGKPVEVDSNQIETLTENNQCYSMREAADILKISKSSVQNHFTSLVMLLGLMFVCHTSEKKKTFLTLFLLFLLRHNKKIPFFTKQIVTDDGSGYCTIMWNRRDCFFSC